MTTQTIYVTSHTANFTVVSNSLINSTLPPVAKAVLQYLISKPKDWRLNKQAIKKTLGISAYAVQRGITILRNLGYLIFERLKTGYGIWEIYDTPQTLMVEPSFEIPTKDNRTVSINTEVLLNTDNNYSTMPAIKEVKEVVVVDAHFEDRPPIELPPTLKGSQAKAATRLLSNITQEQAVMVLMIFKTAQKSGKIANPVGYLHALVKAAQDGTLTAPEDAQNAKPITVHERIGKEREARKQAEIRFKVDNESFFQMMRKRYGERFQVPV